MYIIKLADRLHNMRTVWALSREKAEYIARETLDVWCPMCEFLGMGAVKAEMEDLCFGVFDAQTLREMHAQREAMLQGLAVPGVRSRS